MRWLVLLILVLAFALILIWPFRFSGPDANEAADAAREAIQAELAAPYRVLAADLPAYDTDARKRLEVLAGNLFKVENVIVATSRASGNAWHGDLDADIACALPDDAPDLSLREAAAFAMAYRTICPPNAGARTLRHETRGLSLTRHDGHWVAELEPARATNP